jgi:hypothetical protein
MRKIPNFFTILALILILTADGYSHTSTLIDISIDRSGVLLKGKFYIANGNGTFPTVILLQGFPGNEIDVLGIGKKLSEVDINALTFNYSGTHQSQGKFNFENTQKDIQAVFEFIHKSENIRKYKIDTTRIYLGGYSYGGGMALTYAATHQKITSVFSISGTDHGEFMKEYNRNPKMKQMIDDMFARLSSPSGNVRFAKGGTPKEMAEMKIIESNPTYYLKKSATLLAIKDILLIGGWDDVNVSIDHSILPLYRALKKEKAKNIKIIAFQDSHAYRNSRDRLAQTIIEWLKTSSERVK